MADKKIEIAVEAAPQSAAVASGSTKTADVMVAWTTTVSKQALVLAVQKILHQIQAADPADLD